MSQKYVIVHFFDLVNVLQEFPSSEWPLHVTMLANFTLSEPLDLLRGKLKELVMLEPPFSIVADGQALFGQDQNVAVSLLRPDDSIKKFHEKLVSISSSLGAVFDAPEYMHEGYRPHATIQSKARLIDGQTEIVGDITLVDMFPDGDINGRRVIESYTLAG